MRIEARKEHFEKYISIADALRDSMIEDVNIYNQAFLTNERPLIKSMNIKDKTQHEYATCFQLSGNITGHIICLVDLYKKEQKMDKKLFTSLYNESLNILLGHVTTELEDKFNLLTMISAPAEKSNAHIKQLLSKNFGQHFYVTGYKLITNEDEFDCRIIFNINNHSSERVK